MKTSLVVVTGALACAITACSASSTGTSSPSPAPSDTTSSGTDPAAGDPASDPPADAPAIPAPSMDGIMKMSGALHAVWTLPTSVTCDKVTLERKTSTTDFAVAYTLPGDTDNKHDAQATQDTTYTYRVQCFVGDRASAYSNEKSANPKR
jgi:hypothetical protein